VQFEQYRQTMALPQSDKCKSGIEITGLPGARSEISGPNVYKISGQFQDIFVSFTRLKTQKVHVFSVLIMLFIEADQYCSPKHVTKALL